MSIRPYHGEKDTRGGIILPDTAVEKRGSEIDAGH